MIELVVGDRLETPHSFHATGALMNVHEEFLHCLCSTTLTVLNYIYVDLQLTIITAADRWHVFNCFYLFILYFRGNRKWL